jgi:NitT/TauT family transport system permease protein
MTTSTTTSTVETGPVETATAPRRVISGLGRLPWQYFAVPIALLGIWEAAVDTQMLDPRLIPAPHTVVETWWRWIFGTGGADPYTGTWLNAAAASGQRVLAGFAIAGAVGTIIGLLIGWFTLPRVLMQPVIDILRPIPVTAWVPFVVVFFGIQPTASISLIALGAFFPIALNAAAGAQGTPPVLVSAAQMLGTSRRKILWRVVFPSSLPSILTGLRVGLALAWVLVIVSEMVAVKSGLGFSLWDAYYFGRTDVIVAAMFSVGILGYVSDQILVRATNRILRWAPDVR